MATKVLSNDFMQHIATDEAWKELSQDFNWSETMLEKFLDKVDWNEISSNSKICWTVPMIQKFKNRIQWDSFSENNGLSITESIIEAFKDKWNWHKLSANTNVTMSYELLDKYADLWDWNEIIDRYGYNVLFDNHGIEFYERYKDRIPAAKVQNSSLWREIVSQRKVLLLEEIKA